MCIVVVYSITRLITIHVWDATLVCVVYIVETQLYRQLDHSDPVRVSCVFVNTWARHSVYKSSMRFVQKSMSARSSNWLVTYTWWILECPCLLISQNMDPGEIRSPGSPVQSSYEVPTTFIRSSYTVHASSTQFLQSSYKVPTHIGSFLWSSHEDRGTS